MLLVLVLLAGGSYGLYAYLTPPPLPDGLLYGNGHIEGTEIRVSSEVTGRVTAAGIARSSDLAVIASSLSYWMFTLSKVEVFSAVLLCAVTDRPACAPLAMVTLIVPTGVQVTPSADVDPVNVLPDRASRTQ